MLTHEQLVNNADYTIGRIMTIVEMALAQRISEAEALTQIKRILEEMRGQ